MAQNIFKVLIFRFLELVGSLMTVPSSCNDGALLKCWCRPIKNKNRMDAMEQESGEKSMTQSTHVNPWHQKQCSKKCIWPVNQSMPQNVVNPLKFRRLIHETIICRFHVNNLMTSNDIVETTQCLAWDTGNEQCLGTTTHAVLLDWYLPFCASTKWQIR